MKKIYLYIPNIYKCVNIVSVFILGVALDCFDWSLRLWGLRTTATLKQIHLKMKPTWVVAFHSPLTPNNSPLL